LYVAFELGQREWKLALTSGFDVKPWLRTVAGGDLAAVERVLRAARQRCGLAPTAAVISCYEAGRDGFWIHRALQQLGVANRVVDSASIDVKRRQRRMKTDRIDAIKLVMMLMRVSRGEPDVWAEVRVPSIEAEAARHVSRERTTLRQEQTRLQNQIGSWLATWGCRVSRAQRRQPAWWTTVRTWNDTLLPATVQDRIARTAARLVLLTAQVTTLEAQQVATQRQATATDPLTRLVRLRGLNTISASILLDEGLVWRDFQNRRQLGGLLGFAPARYDSGDSSRDQGITRAGNARLQSVMVQLAWSWVHWQRESALTQWYQARFGRGKRTRKIGIIAVARKLLIALWRYATHGVVPVGARLKTA
jgi:Transposase and inactivated derivatives